MSVKALSNKANFRHSIADEMESLLYVVLYCCARWLRHNNIPDLGEHMQNFFNVVQKAEGKDVGGQGKTFQMMNRFFTDPFIFENKNVGQWINGMFELLWPRDWPDDETIRPNWTTEAVQRLWEETLKRNLPEDGRQDHEVGDVIGEAPVYFPTHISFKTSDLLSLSVYKSSSTSLKRSAEDDGTKSGASNKRPRVDTIQQSYLNKGHNSGIDRPKS